MKPRHGHARTGLRAPVLALLIAAATTACGYAFGSGLPATGVRTIALEVVTNESFRQRLEADLTAALARELPISTDLRLVAVGRADATLRVVITGARERTLVPGGPGDPIREGTIEAAVRMQLVARAGETLIDRTLLDRTEFRSPIGEDLTSASRELVDDLARKIALALETDF